MRSMPRGRFLARVLVLDATPRTSGCAARQPRSQCSSSPAWRHPVRIGRSRGRLRPKASAE
eukprot:10142344-Alexandrium_andersonii.AAC.1